MHTVPSYLKTNKKDVALLACVAGSLVVATIIVSPKRPMWFDEIFSWTLITDPSFRHMLYALRMAADSAPGLYHLLARLWLALTGQSILALRLFSTFADVVAIAAIWTTLRRAFSLQATAIGVLTVFCTSVMMLFQSAEARFYPLFIACTALAIAAYARAVEIEVLNWKLAAGLFFSNLALVQSHIYGVAFSAALLFALICCDIVVRRVRPLVYFCVAATWFSLLPWIPTLQRINEQTKPRHWIYPPTAYGLVEFYQLYSLELPMILFAVALLCILARFAFADQSRARTARTTSIFLLICLTAGAACMRTYPTTLDLVLLAFLIALAGHGLRREPGPQNRLRRALLAAAAVLLAAPPAAAIFSIVVKPVFVPKYVAPSMLGVAILLTWITESGSRFPLAGQRAAMIGAGWSGLLIALVLTPVLSAMRENADQSPPYGVSNRKVEVFIPPGMPVAVESYFQFLPLLLGTTRPDKPYFYVGDIESASSPNADHSALLHYRGAALWKKIGYLFPPNAPDWHDFLATHSTFAVLHSPGYFWFDWRIRNNPEYNWRRVGIVDQQEVILVQRRQAGSVTLFNAAPSQVSTSMPPHKQPRSP
jgi:hypothetical protein